MMKSNNLIGMFILISILMHLLHTSRGSELKFIIEGSLPYVLYHGTMALYAICLLCHVCEIARNLYGKLKK